MRITVFYHVIKRNTLVETLQRLGEKRYLNFKNTRSFETFCGTLFGILKANWSFTKRFIPHQKDSTIVHAEHKFLGCDTKPMKYCSYLCEKRFSQLCC
jgi:hypothetical protein